MALIQYELTLSTTKAQRSATFWCLEKRSSMSIHKDFCIKHFWWGLHCCWTFCGTLMYGFNLWSEKQAFLHNRFLCYRPWKNKCDKTWNQGKGSRDMGPFHLWVRSCEVRLLERMMWRARMVGSVPIKNILKELLETCGFTLGALGTWVFAQSKVHCKRGGKRCTLETVRSIWAWRKWATSKRQTSDSMINWRLWVKRELEGEIPGSAPPLNSRGVGWKLRWGADPGELGPTCGYSCARSGRT